MTPEGIAKLISWNPSRRYGLGAKGTIDADYDADIALVDPSRTWTVRAEDSESTQEYTPFEGIEMTAAVTDVYLRGTQIVRDGTVVGEPTGRYVRRPMEQPD